MKPFNLFMISAMYENGGNTTHRMLDGHPEILAYPFESQVGTSLVNDYLTSYVPFRYRWPEFPMTGLVENDYELFFDEEMKTRLRTPERSKFKMADLQIDEAERKRLFVESMNGLPRTRANLVDAFFRSTFDSWKNCHRTGQEKAWLGYNPVQVLDTEKILADFPAGHVIHVVRNPYSGYSDTKKRPFPISLERYTWTWNYCQHLALTYAERYPKNFHIVRFEDLIADRRATMTKLCRNLGLSFSENCLYPSWNGKKLEQVYPWGTIRVPTSEVNVATMNHLNDMEKAQIKSLSIVMQRQLGYESFWTGPSAKGCLNDMELAATALDVDAYQDWRGSCFYPKADLPLPDSVLRGDSLPALDETEIAAACSDILGEAATVMPLAERGTFHRLWRVQRQSGERLICRVNALSPWFRDYPLWIETYVGQRLLGESLPIVRSRAVDLTRQRCPYDFALVDEAKGQPLTVFDGREAQLLPLLQDLGRVLARVHRIEIADGYGLLDAQALMRTGGQLLGSHTSWDNYLLTKLDAHVRRCVAIGAITEEEAQRIHWLFEDSQSLYAGAKPSLLHGDPGLHNAFAEDGKITALIDWEDAVAGDPVYEIAFWATFHPERRHQAFLEGYGEEVDLPTDFEPRFWLYYLRVALAKTVLRDRLGLRDRPGREPAAQRIRLGLNRLEAACSTI